MLPSTGGNRFHPEHNWLPLQVTEFDMRRRLWRIAKIVWRVTVDSVRLIYWTIRIHSWLE